MVEPLGINGAEVYLGLDLATGSRVALKVWSGVHNSEYHKHEAASARLRHPNIVEVLEVGETPRGPFSVFEWLPPPTATLASRIKAKELSGLDVVKVLVAVVRAVQYARTQGMYLVQVHPSDIVFSEANVPKLLPVFAEDTAPTTERDDLHQLGSLIAFATHGRSTVKPWRTLRTIGVECAGAPSSQVESMEALASMLSDLVGESDLEPGSGPTKG